ncbi:MAG TPA: c-type cytochrome [Sphingomonas sp.]
MTPKIRAAAGLAMLVGLGLPFAHGAGAANGGKARLPAKAADCGAADAGITLPPGFCATVFADGLGHARHMAVAPDGTLYVNTWSGRYYRNAPPPPEAGFMVALRDTDGDGRADRIERFGPSPAKGGTGGTGIALFGSGLYAEAGADVVRYALAPGRIAPAGPPEVVVSGLPLEGDHPMHPFVIDRTGALFLNSGSATNACQPANRKPGISGADPCTELETRAGLWRYDAKARDQRFSPAGRYATGIRNTGGLAFDGAGRLLAVQHGRDQLSQNWPAHFSTQAGVELPAEELVVVKAGADYGWPRCYYDPARHALMLAPEYGGDGKAVGACATKTPPVAAFPAHWAPNDLMIYAGSSFPTAYRGGAFIAFHGSWNRAPAPQDGYNIVFQPMRDGRAVGHYIVFANGFAGAFEEPGRARFRPAGLAQAPDGALYIADDREGRIWRITYRGSIGAGLVPARNARAAPAATADDIAPERLALPPGTTAKQVALGRAIFLGKARGGTCGGCHGSDARGTSVGPDLTTKSGLWTDGSIVSIARIIREGVPNPKRFPGAMPARGGADLSAADVDALAAYLVQLQNGKPAL